MREATEPVGHAVRQLYLAAGVTDVYLETGDASLLDGHGASCGAGPYAEKTYVTGAHGSRHRDEAFGDPYELPPDRAYGETCAAIASFMWNWRLLLATGRGRYADEMERALYNAIAVSTSLDGRHFTYSNPLHLRERPRRGERGRAVASACRGSRCACCPPNVARLVASLHRHVATRDERRHPAAPLHGRPRRERTAAALTVATGYPWDGRRRRSPSRATGASGRSRCGSRPGARRADDRRRAGRRAGADGYLRLRRAWAGRTQVVLELPMPVRVLAPHPRIDAVRGCVALARGPLVYCVEQADHPPASRSRTCASTPPCRPRRAAPNRELGVPVTLSGPATIATGAPDELYPALRPRRAAPAPATLTAIPYFRWANRGPNAMRVWIPTA